MIVYDHTSLNDLPDDQILWAGVPGLPAIRPDALGLANEIGSLALYCLLEELAHFVVGPGGLRNDEVEEDYAGDHYC